MTKHTNVFLNFSCKETGRYNLQEIAQLYLDKDTDLMLDEIHTIRNVDIVINQTSHLSNFPFFSITALGLQFPEKKI